MSQFKFNKYYNVFQRQYLFEDVEEPAAPAEEEKLTSEKWDPVIVRSLINAIRTYMKETIPYFGYLLDNMPIIVTTDPQIPTMAVDKERNLYINPEFMMKIAEGYIEFNQYGFKIKAGNNPVAFVIAHEVYHVFNETFERQRNRTAWVMYGQHPVNLWNIATDFEMNYRLQYDYNMIPPKDGMLADDKGFGKFWVTLNKYMIKGSNAERIYDAMLKDVLQIIEDQKKMIKLEPDQSVPPTYKYKVGDKVLLKDIDPPEWHEVVKVLPDGNLETKPIGGMPKQIVPLSIFYR